MQETNQTTKRTKSYTCELCQKVFTQKIDYTRHTKKKNACVSLNQLQEIVQTEQVIRQTINDEKTILINIFKSCLNILRDNEGLTGEKALRTLSHLLTWKLLEQHFGGEINIDNYEYKFEEYFEDEVLEHNKKRELISYIPESIRALSRIFLASLSSSTSNLDPSRNRETRPSAYRLLCRSIPLPPVSTCPFSVSV